MQVVAVVALIAAIGWRNRRWRLVWLPWAALVGVALAVAAYWYVARRGWRRHNPAPHSLWIWIGLSGVAAGVLVAGWRGARGGGAARRCWRCRCACCVRRWR